MGQLVVLSECVCPGSELRLECTVVGGVTTVWRGTAFDCEGDGDRITLRHSQFDEGRATGVCNNGIIIGHNHNKTSDGRFISQLIIHLPLLNTTNDYTLDDRTVQCVHVSLTSTFTVIGTHTIAYTRDSESRITDSS